ncbi:uncharacterized protein MYCFIDRAFT_172813 [Pseudocercospora fijiensis CIRAD86]|uniref:Uncharacterized protein n=1 Tax=Pseudocercospora fijiensis (strain CIRAD86) TaxID=383855 RepID=M3B2Z7_PSEFD|nr:uncharacterized protein MYCFIDRAFT_172813 [Pseudocercospora fijiensis CIRAD86]EME83738.1 hypothetical protein MYCFIDRAFT_172813 [Pseudocercospora fijiensis CIRAD86]
MQELVLLSWQAPGRSLPSIYKKELEGCGNSVLDLRQFRGSVGRLFDRKRFQQCSCPDRRWVLPKEVACPAKNTSSKKYETWRRVVLGKFLPWIHQGFYIGPDGCRRDFRYSKKFSDGWDGAKKVLGRRHGGRKCSWERRR